jgi:uncharacterized membrane protein
MLYSQTFEVSLMILHYFMVDIDYGIFFMLQEIFLMLLVTLIFYYYSCEIGKISDSIGINKIIAVPLVAINVLYVCGFSAASISLALEEEYTFICNDWIWLYSSLCGFVLSFVLLGFGCYMSRKLSSMTTYSIAQVDKIRYKQLW